MPLDPEIPRFDRDQIHRADLARLSELLRQLQRYFSDNFREGGQADTPPFPLIDMFPAIVRSDGGSPGVPQYTDHVRYYVSRAATKEGLGTTDVYNAAAETITGFSAIITASNLAALDPAGAVAPVPAGTIVHCFRLANRGTASTDGDSTPSRPLYVFYWQTPATIVVRIDSNATGGGFYSGTLFGGKMSASGAISAALPAGLTAGQSCLVENLDEQGQPTHWLTAGGSSYAEGVYAGASTEATPRPLIRVQRGRYRTASTQLLGSSSERLTPDAANWRADQITSGSNYGDMPIDLWVCTGVWYDDTSSSPALTAHMRKVTVAADGRIAAVSAETDYVIDTPDVNCP